MKNKRFGKFLTGQEPGDLLNICWVTVIWLFLIIGGTIFPGTLTVLMLLNHPNAFELAISAGMCWIIFDVGKVVIKYPPWKL